MHMENMDKTTLKYFKSVLFLLNVTARVKFILWYKNSFVMSTKILRDYWALTSPKAFTLKYRSIRSTAWIVRQGDDASLHCGNNFCLTQCSKVKFKACNMILC